MNTPAVPDETRRERLLSVTAEFVARGGAASLMLPPVKPGSAAFPEPWKPTRGGVTALLRRLAWHAGGLGERSVTLDDQRMGAPPTEQKPQTRVELVEVREKELAFVVGFIGEDDIVGTLAHEIGVAFAALHRPSNAANPYRIHEEKVIAIESDRDLERGSIATVYLGLGVLAANAAFQQYSSRAGVDAYQPHIYEVHRAGYANMSDLAFLLAVQALVRGERVPPPGLGPPQRDEVSAWIAALAGHEAELRERLGVSATAAEDAQETELERDSGHEGGREHERASDGEHGRERAQPTSRRRRGRPTPVRFLDVDLGDDITPVKRNAFRWETHRGGVGMIAGLALGVGIAFAAAPSQLAFWSMSIAGVGAGNVVGRKVRAVRCSSCATVIGAGAPSCSKCGAIMRGEIRRLSERLEAEERLESERPS